MKKFNKWMIVTFIFGILIDQGSKYIVVDNLHLMQEYRVIPGFFSLTYVQNRGAAWSMLEGHMSFFYIIGILAIIIMTYLYRHQDNQYTKLGLILMLSGTIGNLIDRVLHRYVIDFLAFDIFGYHFPVFNIADMLLVGGVILILFIEMFGDYMYGRKIIKNNK